MDEDTKAALALMAGWILGTAVVVGLIMFAYTPN